MPRIEVAPSKYSRMATLEQASTIGLRRKTGTTSPYSGPTESWSRCNRDMEPRFIMKRSINKNEYRQRELGKVRGLEMARGGGERSEADRASGRKRTLRRSTGSQRQWLTWAEFRLRPRNSRSREARSTIGWRRASLARVLGQSLRSAGRAILQSST